MSDIYASITSDASKNEVHRRAHKWETVWIRGWGAGVKVEAIKQEDDKIAFIVSKTGGSNAGSSGEKIAEVIQE